MEKEDREKEREEENPGELQEVFICCQVEKKLKQVFTSPRSNLKARCNFILAVVILSSNKFHTKLREPLST